MNSAGDLPKEGFPHSDIRGSTIARISPRLFAACHVLHRLLAPRHPPNALITLEITTPPPARRTKPRPLKRIPQPSSKAARAYAQPHSTYAYQPILSSPVKDHFAPSNAKHWRNMSSESNPDSAHSHSHASHRNTSTHH